MPIPIMLSTVSSSEVNPEVEALGARVVGQWAVLGPSDVVTLVQASDHETSTRVLVILSVRRTVHCLVMPPRRSCLPDGAQPASQRVGRLQE